MKSLSKIGSGGMAYVYKARDRKLSRLVAIKILKEEFCKDKSFVAKFRMEAQAAAGLIHPNIVNVYDVGEDRGLNYMVMELVEGITLKRIYREKREDFLIKRRSVLRFRCAAVSAQHMHRELSIAISNHRILLFPRTER